MVTVPSLLAALLSLVRRGVLIYEHWALMLGGIDENVRVHMQGHEAVSVPNVLQSWYPIAIAVMLILEI